MATIQQAKAWARKNYNFMTPQLVSMVQASDNLFIELSKGESFDHGDMFGVSVIEFDTEDQKFSSASKLGFNKALFNLDDARRYRDEILEQLEGEVEQ